MFGKVYSSADDVWRWRRSLNAHVASAGLFCSRIMLTKRVKR